MQLVANLDVERHWQRLLLPRCPMPQLGRRALDLASAYGTLLRAWTESEEPGVLWTPAPVAPSRLTNRLAIPRLISGHLDTRTPSLSWGRLDETAARVNHRRFGFDLSRRLGLALPGSAWTESLEATLDAVADHDRWVAKAPLSASGRDRVIGSGPPDEASVRRLRNLLRRSDGLLVEPWLERVDDFGVLIDVEDGGAHVVSLHRQIVDERGAFVGIDWPLETPPWAEELREHALAVGEALHVEGFRGPAGVDAWTWRRDEGSPEKAIVLNPLGEINARLSFGWVARQIARRLGHQRVKLRLGSGRQMAAASQVEPLLLPDQAGAGAAWLEP